MIARSLVAVFALVGAVQPGRADVLDDLMARARGAQALHASYSLKFKLKPGSTATPPPDGEIRIDYAAPGKLRIENRMGGQTLFMWCVDERMTTSLVNESTKGVLFGSVDVSSMRSALATVEATLEQTFPDAPKPASEFDGPAALVNWSFDRRTQRANFDVVASPSGQTSPYGWLDTLRRKQVGLEAHGEVLRFVSDGHFRGEIDARSGLLTLLHGESPNGEFDFTLTESSATPNFEEGFFDAPLVIQGARDSSAELRHGALRGLHEALRSRIYVAIDGASAADPDARSKADRVLRAFHDNALASTLEAWFELARRKRDTVVERLRAFGESGRTPAQVEEQRQVELASLRKQIDELERTFDSRLELTDVLRRCTRAEQTHELELRAFAAAFEARVRKPVLDGFEEATRTK